MKRKLALTINQSRFDIELDQEFADFFETQVHRDLKFEKNNEVKALLQAYIRLNYALFEQEKTIERIMDKVKEQAEPNA